MILAMARQRYSSSHVRLALCTIAFCCAFRHDNGVASGFVVSTSPARHHVSPLRMTTASPRMGELTEPEQKVYDVLHELHQSKYPFRSVVIGKTGAILESTALLGPVLNISQQPSTGANLLTLASDDKSFELHLTLNKVSKIVFVTRETPDKVMRLVRLLNAEGDSMCSLILAAGDDKEAASWFDGLVKQFGNEVQL